MSPYQLKQSIRIGARKCIIELIPEARGRAFLKSNHKRKDTPYDFAYGLKYRGELVFLMAMKDNLLIRMGTKEGYCVVGGASRLFNHILKNHSFSEIVSRCSRENSGAIYTTLGFSLTKQTRKVTTFIWTLQKHTTNQ